MPPIISESEARKKALNWVDGAPYFWEDPNIEEALKRRTRNPNASYYPSGNLIIAHWLGDKEIKGNNAKLAWVFQVFDQSLEKAQTVFIDAVQGRVIRSTPLVHKNQRLKN